MSKKMYRKKQLAAAVASVISLSSLTTMAQDKGDEEPQFIEEVVVTGSAIKREDLEGSLPIQIFDVKAITKSGVANTSELIAQIPAMQGFLTPADSVGGGGGGIQTANIHGIGDEYTLSLMNGRRLAPGDSGGRIDLRAIPLSALESVEVLTDGASALYGSDAIAGVVNFRLKEEVDGTTISARYDSPQESGGETLNFGLTTGLGKFDDDGYSFVFSYSHEEKEQLKSVDRDFAKSGILTVDHPGLGQQGLFFNGSNNAIPGNARVRYIDPAIVDDPDTDADERLTTYQFNPFFQANGECAANNALVLVAKDTGNVAGETCSFDFTSTIEIIPESDRDSLFLNGRVAVNDNLSAFGTIAYSDSSLTARIAPYPTGFVPIPKDSQLVADHILPNLTDVQKDNLTVVQGQWRALAAGNRTTEYTSTATTAIFGLDGSVGKIDYDTAITYSKNDQEQNYPTGWLLLEEFNNLVSSGGLNIFVTPDQLPASELEALQGAVYSGNWDAIETEVFAFDATASMPLAEMGGGESVLAMGLDVRQTSYVRTIAEANENERLLFLSKDTPYDLTRSQWGIFAEYFMPFTDTFEMTASLRHDSISKITDKSGFLVRDEALRVAASQEKVGSTMSDTTFKLTTRWDATDTLALRASFGTAFKAPTMRQIAEPRSDFGVTSGTFKCPFPATDPLARFCFAGESQYPVFREGTADLEPETSEQLTAGFVFRPSDDSSLTVDYWSVEIENIVERLTQTEIFNNPEVNRDLFTTRRNNSTGEDELAIIQRAVNAGTFDAQGIDYKFSQGFDTSIGDLTTSVAGTYMIESESSLNGSSLGRFGNAQNVVFRNRLRLSASLDHGMFSHNLAANYRSGYRDQGQTVNLIDSTTGAVDFSEDTPIQLYIPSYTTVDYQAKLDLMDDQLELLLGINNLLDKQPPLSLRTEGAGHQVGWDPRYVDPYGRTFYLRANFNF